MPQVEVEPHAWKLSELPRLIRSTEGFPEILASLDAGHSATIDGAWGSSCALVAAALAERVPRTLVVVTPHIADVDDLRDDIQTFRGGPVHIFPAWESLPREERIDDQTYGERLRLLLGILVFAVGLRFAYELVIKPDDLYSLRYVRNE